MTCIENVEIGQGVDRSVDEILCRIRDAEASLEKAEGKMSDECLAAVVRMGEVSVVEEAIGDVDGVVGEAERGMLEARRMVDGLLRRGI